jgi:hypothetical protein
MTSRIVPRLPQYFSLIISATLLVNLLGAVHAQSIPSSLGWYQIPGTQLRNFCPPNGFGGSSYAFRDNCWAVTAAWNSAAFDSTRNRLIIWGGGHGDYLGNEIYALELNSLKMQRLTNPALPLPSDSCPDALVGGTQPNSRHTYDGIAYIPNLDKMFVFGGALSPCGYFNASTWLFNFGNLQWEKKNPSGTIPQPDPGIVTAYDPNSGKIFLHDNLNLYTYAPATNSYQKLTNNGAGIDYHMTGVIDPVRRRLLIIGNGHIWAYDISAGSSYTKQSLSTTGGSAVINASYPGLTYDPVTDGIVAWIGGNTVYSLNLETNTWTATSSFTGGPGSALPNGTYKRWSYAPASGVFVLVNSADQNAYTFRLSSGGTTPLPPADTAAPSNPTSLLATSTSSSQINLSWTASTDNVGITAYRIERCQGSGCTNFAQTTSITAPFYSDIGLSAGTTYTYRIRAEDAAGNSSGYSNTSSATTRIQPVAPTLELSAAPTSVGSGSATVLTWSSANASSCTATGGWSGSKPTSGSQSSGPLNANTAFTLTCSGTGGSISQEAPVTVTSSTSGGSPILLVDFGKTSASSIFGLSGWSTVLKDIYTDYRDIGPAGTTIVVGDNYSYNFQGVSGTARPFVVGEKIRATWYNNSPTRPVFTPNVSFTDSDRVGSGATGVWYPMSTVTIPPFGSATSEYTFMSSSVGFYSLVNLNVNYTNNQIIVADKIELVPAGSSNPLSFDFSLATSGNPSVIPGQAISSNITATLVSGISEAAGFSVSGLPSGATGTFSQTLCNPTCSTTLDISTLSTTAIGNHTITVTAVAGSVTRTASFVLTVTTSTNTPQSGILPIGQLIHDGPPTPEQISLLLPVLGYLPQTATATVRYKRSSSSTWITGHPLFRIQPTLSTSPYVGFIPDAFAWPIIDLAPGTSYDVEVTVTSGTSSEIRTGSFTTRPLPPVRATSNKTITPGSSSSTIQSVLNNLVPGDVLEFKNGIYSIDNLQLARSGTTENPIYIRGESRPGVVLSDPTGRIFHVLDASHMVVENMTLRGSGIDSGTSASSVGIQFHDGSPRQTRVTIRNVTITGVDVGIKAYHEISEFLAYDNTLIGNNTWTPGLIDTNATWDDDGINIPGYGNCAFNNTLHGFGDSFAVDTASLATDSIGIYFYRNDIRNSGDDSFEADGAHRNISFYDNRIHNAMSFLSLDPLFGGPLLFARNIIINVGRTPFKWNSQNSGQFIYNNTIVETRLKNDVSGWYQPNNGAQRAYGYQNNILIYRGNGAYTPWLESPGHDPVDWTHNSWFPNRGVQWGGVWNSLAAAQAGISSTTQIFSGTTKRLANDNIITSDPFLTPIILGNDYHTEVAASYIPQLASGSPAKSSGTIIANITDGFSGVAPDRGAIISGKPTVQYGDRGPITGTPPAAPTALTLQ